MADIPSYDAIDDIRNMAKTGKSVVGSMGSLKEQPYSLDQLHFVPAQIAKIPLDDAKEVYTEVTLGPKAKKPFRVSSPVLVSGLSYGAVSKNVKLIIADAAATLGVGFNSGEGGVLEEELEAADYLIMQYATGRFGVKEALLKEAAAVEIRFGQGAYPGKGSFLPASKVTSDVARIRGLHQGEDAYSPAHHPDMESPEEVRKKVLWIRKLTGGVPVGAKIGCGNVEEDLKVLIEAGVDFVSLDGFGGGTGATELYVRENVGIPIWAALPRAHRFLKKQGVRDRISLVAGGGLRTSADFAKCLCLGADAVYIGTAALIALGCDQYRVCHTGLCPKGVTSNNPSLAKQLDIEEGTGGLMNFMEASTHEIAGIARLLGKDDVSSLDQRDLISMDPDLARLIGVRWLDGLEIV